MLGLQSQGTPSCPLPLAQTPSPPLPPLDAPRQHLYYHRRIWNLRHRNGVMLQSTVWTAQFPFPSTPPFPFPELCLFLTIIPTIATFGNSLLPFDCASAPIMTHTTRPD